MDLTTITIAVLLALSLLGDTVMHAGTVSVEVPSRRISRAYPSTSARSQRSSRQVRRDLRDKFGVRPLDIRARTSRASPGAGGGGQNAQNVAYACNASSATKPTLFRFTLYVDHGRAPAWSMPQPHRREVNQ